MALIHITKENFKKENLKKGQFLKFVSMIFKQKKLLVYIAALSLLITGIGIAGSYIFQYIIDAGLNNIVHTEGAAEWFQTFMVLIAGLVWNSDFARKIINDNE